MITAKALDIHLDQLFALLERLHSALAGAGIEYRVIGGLAVFFQVSARDHDAARVTRDVDIAVDRSDLDRISRAAETFGFRHRHVAGIDMLVNAESPKAKSAVHLVFVREKVRPGDLSAIPGFSDPTKTMEGFLLAPVLGSGPNEADQFPAQGQNPHRRHGFRRFDHARDRSGASGRFARAIATGSRRKRLRPTAVSFRFENFREGL